MKSTTAHDDDVALANDARQGEVALRKVYDFIGRFVAYPTEHARVAHVLWIAHAHRMDLWESTPRLSVLSPEAGSGKTRVLEISELLVPNPVLAVNVSPAYLFRKVGDEDARPTILFDEIDTVFGPKAKENEELRGLLNAGHRRGAVAGRCVVRGKIVETEEIPAYAAVAMAGLGWLPDTIMTRSVLIRMRKRHPDEKVEPFRRRLHLPEGTRVCGSLAAWAASLPSAIIWPALPNEIQDRAADVWEPLIAMADAAGGDWPARARAAAVALVEESKEVDPSLGVRLLADLRVIFGDADEMATSAILTALHGLTEAPWGDLKGKPINDRGLATRLRQYGIKSKTIRVSDHTPKGYRRVDLHDAWQRYLPPSLAKCATTATSATTVEPVAQNVADDPPNVADVSDRVADTSDEDNNNINDVAAVAPVADFKAHSRHQECWHCHKSGDTVMCCYADAEPWLHHQCLDAWVAAFEDINPRVQRSETRDV